MTLDTFEQSLLTELRRHVAASTARRTMTRRRLAWAGVPAFGAAVAAVIGLTLGSSPAAYAVSETSNGDVVVTITQLDDAAGLEQALAAKNVRAEVTYAAHFSQHPGRSRTAHSADPADCTIQLAKIDGGLRFTLGAAQIAAGSELDIVTSGSSPADVGSPVAVYWSGGPC